MKNTQNFSLHYWGDVKYAQAFVLKGPYHWKLIFLVFMKSKIQSIRFAIG